MRGGGTPANRRSQGRPMRASPRRQASLKRHDRLEHDRRAALLLNKGSDRRRRIARVEEDSWPARAGVSRRRARERAREQDRCDERRHDDRAEDEQRVTLFHRAVVRRCGAMIEACAAMRLATPRMASARTVVPSTKKNASAASDDAAAMTLLTAAPSSSPRSMSWYARNASEGSASAPAAIHSQATAERSVSRRITSSRNPTG